MIKKNTQRMILGAALLAGTCGGAQAAVVTGMKITEWMYNPSGTAPATGSPGEYVEFTNFGPTAIDMTGWSFDDNSRTAGSESLSGFGLVNPGESVIFTEATAADFRTAWGLSNSVKVIGGNVDNLGRSDEVNLYDASSNLVDRLTYNDQATPTALGPRTQGTSGRPGSLSAIGANNAALWVLETVGDADHAYKSVAFGTYTGGDIGSPGYSAYAAPVPLPAAVWLLGSGLMGLAGVMRRKAAV